MPRAELPWMTREQFESRVEALNKTLLTALRAAGHKITNGKIPHRGHHVYATVDDIPVGWEWDTYMSSLRRSYRVDSDKHCKSIEFKIRARYRQDGGFRRRLKADNTIDMTGIVQEIGRRVEWARNDKDINERRKKKAVRVRELLQSVDNLVVKDEDLHGYRLNSRSYEHAGITVEHEGLRFNGMIPFDALTTGSVRQLVNYLRTIPDAVDGGGFAGGVNDDED
jgi:hypothetical protein